MDGGWASVGGMLLVLFSMAVSAHELHASREMNNRRLPGPWFV